MPDTFDDAPYYIPGPPIGPAYVPAPTIWTDAHGEAADRAFGAWLDARPLPAHEWACGGGETVMTYTIDGGPEISSCFDMPAHPPCGGHCTLDCPVCDGGQD